MPTAAFASSALNRADKQRAKELAKEEAVLASVLKANESFESPEERQKWLETHDKDGSGVFERSEFGALLKDVAKTLLPEADESKLTVPEPMVLKFYKDKEGLSVDEVYAALKRCISYIKSQLKLIELFKSVDLDGNGMLNRSELKSLLEKACPPKRKVSEADVNFILKECDVNEDECIDLDELSLAVSCWLDVIKGLPDAHEVNMMQEKKSMACVVL